MIQYYFEALALNIIFYLVASLSFFGLFWVIGRKKWSWRRIQNPVKATQHDIQHDIIHAFYTLLLIAVLDVAIFKLDSFSLIYYEADKYGWAWLFLSFPLLLVLDDTYFYWTHRWMHQPHIYKYVHSTHHSGTDPSPFTALSFQPAEALIQHILIYSLHLILPLHIGVFIVWQIVTVLNNAVSHLGYELYPKNWTKIPFLKYKTTSTHHNMHHQDFHGNYSIHFTWWDKIMGTELPDCELKHAAIFERSRIEPTHPVAIFAPPKLASSPTIEITTIAKISVVLDKQTYEFEGNPNINILESALQQNIPLPHQCKNGICGKCKLFCVDGEVNQPEKPGLNTEERQNGYILSCQSLPVSKNISLKN
jgi:lathosterol oxidase